MRFTKYINELAMTKNVDFKIVRNSKYEFEINIFLENSEKFYFFAEYDEKHFASGWEGVWDIGFADENGDATMSPKDKGIALQLFAALPKAVDIFLNAKKPEVFGFSAKTKEKSRVVLYDRLAKIIEKRTPYRIGEIGSNGGTKFYIFEI